MKRRELLLWAVVIVGIPLSLLIPVVRDAWHAEQAMQCKNRLKQIVLAIHNYHQAFGHLPPVSVTDEGGVPVHSWRAAVTPYMAALPQVYRWEEPWNGPSNARLLRRTTIHIAEPPGGCAKGLPWDGPIDYALVLRCPHGRNRTAYHIDYYAVVGDACIWSSAKPNTVMFADDGLANTILIVESQTLDAFWSEPVDLSFDNMSFKINDPSAQSISSKHPLGPAVGFADGEVFRLNPLTPEEIVRALLTANGDEKISRKELIQAGWLR